MEQEKVGLLESLTQSMKAGIKPSIPELKLKGYKRRKKGVVSKNQQSEQLRLEKKKDKERKVKRRISNKNRKVNRGK